MYYNPKKLFEEGHLLREGIIYQNGIKQKPR